MAHIEINKKEFNQLIGEKIPEEKLKEEASLLGVHWNPVEGKKWDVETYPNRPDLLSVEGLARAYKGFFNIETGLESYKTTKGKTKIHIDDSVKEVRPYIGGAIIRDVELTQRKINGLVQLQEKLHETTGRRRDKIAIGLHDLDQVKPPFTYKAVEPEEVSFKPLEYNKEIHLEQILTEHEKGQEYSWILEDEEKYPIIIDSEEQILSFPPIINNQLTEVTPETTDIFIDVTGKDKQTVKKIVNILSTALAERGGQIETVKIDDIHMPILEPETKTIEKEYVQEITGIELSSNQIVERLEKMKYGAKKKRNNKIKVKIPSYRNDIMHDYDIIEDIVIAHRYPEIEPELPQIDTEGGQKPIENFSDLIREILHGTGALETNTFILSSKEKLFTKNNLDKQEEIAEMDNPLTKEYQSVRNWMLPSHLQVLQNNKHRSYPQKFYETADVVNLENGKAENVRKMVYTQAGNNKDYTDIKQVLQVLERDLDVNFQVEQIQKPFLKSERAGEIYLNDVKVGYLGEIDKDVLKNWELNIDAVALEINLDKVKKLRK